MATPVQNIACANNAAFVMSFGLEIFSPDLGGFLIIEGYDSGNFPVAQTRVVDLAANPATQNLAEGTFIRPQIRPVAGGTHNGDLFVQFARNGQTATYEVRGTLFGYTAHLLGAPT